MLERDRRKAARHRHAQRLARREWLEKNEKWATCPNHGKSATLNDRGIWRGTPCLDFFPANCDYQNPNSRNFDRDVLVCYTCRSSWLTNTHMTHP